MKQLNLFESNGHYSVPPRTPSQILSQEAFVDWKTRIYDYQQQTRSQKVPQQTTLFDCAPSPIPQAAISQSQDLDPFKLKLHPSLFWRLKDDAPQGWGDSQQGCVYFILDTVVPLLLYIGETKLSANARWSGTRD